jgi:hypothetical protein
MTTFEQARYDAQLRNRAEQAEMRGWLKDCNLPSELSDTAVRNAVRRHYEGGIERFRADMAASWL